MQTMKINLNKMSLQSIGAFFSVSGKFSGGEKDCYFLRYIGFDQESSYSSALTSAEEAFLRSSPMRKAGYCRVESLPFRPTPDEIDKYNRALGQLESAGPAANSLELQFAFDDPLLRGTQAEALNRTLELFRQASPHCSESMLKNFTIKLLFWMDTYFPKLFLPGFRPQASPKFTFFGPIKLQEYLFLYLLTRMGCDVLYLNPEQDADLPPQCSQLSQLCRCANCGKIQLPPFTGLTAEEPEASAPAPAAQQPVQTPRPASAPPQPSQIPAQPQPSAVPSPVLTPSQPAPGPIPVPTPEPVQPAMDPVPPTRPQPAAPSSTIPSWTAPETPSMPSGPYQAQLPGQRPAPSPSQIPPNTPPRNRQSAAQQRPAVPARPQPSPAATAAASRQPLEYEQLAALAASVVMVEVADRNGSVFKSGSGVMLGRDGYILTNFHVVDQGALYGIRIEGEDRIYETSRIIKCHPLFDLAILQIDRQLTPIPLCRDQQLTRGQKVVAIGSPLGLFNTVSDGIISAFRTVRDVPMIQFTAPISSGSSGGAVLNMYGELIGLSTAGIDDGQNLNLAVGYETIRAFAKGLF